MGSYYWKILRSLEAIVVPIKLDLSRIQVGGEMNCGWYHCNIVLIAMVNWGFVKGEVSLDEIEVGARLGWSIGIYFSQESTDTKLRYKNRI